MTITPQFKARSQRDREWDRARQLEEALDSKAPLDVQHCLDLIADGVLATERTANTMSLIFAVRRSPEIVEALLTAGVNPNWQDGNSCAALHYAAGYGDSAMVSLLLKHGADPNLVCRDDCPSPLEDWMSPLGVAACARDAESVRLMLDAGADPKAMERPALERLQKWTTREIWDMLDAAAVALAAKRNINRGQPRF